MSDNLRDDEYTPTTEQVRNNMALGVTMAHFMPEDAANVDFPVVGWREEAKADFDRWFESVAERRVAEATREIENMLALVLMTAGPVTVSRSLLEDYTPDEVTFVQDENLDGSVTVRALASGQEDER